MLFSKTPPIPFFLDISPYIFLDIIKPKLLIVFMTPYFYIKIIRNKAGLTILLNQQKTSTNHTKTFAVVKLVKI